MDGIAIKTKDLCKTYKLGDGSLFYASNNINIDIKQGKLTVLKGRSGSGKTTLLNQISALDTPSSGEIFFFDRNLATLDKRQIEDIRRYQMGFVFQSVALIPVMTAYENVDFALRLANTKGHFLNKKERHERILEVMEKVELTKRMDHMAGRLSGGEQQRVAIARAMVHNPRVIYADEPTGALDTATGLGVMRMFKNIVATEGVTIIMTTHDPNLMDMADDAFELSDGRIIR